jgi:hypothetical protein
VFLLCICLSAVLRCRTYLLTRRVQAVLAGLAQVRVGQTTEGQLLKAVPSLTRYGPDTQYGEGVERLYHVTISNDGEAGGMLGMEWIPTFFFSFPSLRDDQFPRNKWVGMSLPFKVAYVLGWRHLLFRASAIVLDGVVAKMAFGIEPDAFFGWPASAFVVVRSAHGFWLPHTLEVPVPSTDDESPDFRYGPVAGAWSSFSGTDSAIGVVFTASAPAELASHAFQWDLSCFWGIRGCDSTRQVVPLLWADQQKIFARTAARLASQNPCPDRILAGRVRTLPDLGVALLEVVNSRSAESNYGNRLPEIVIDYRLKEIILGHPKGPWTAIHDRQSIPWPSASKGEISNPVRPPHPQPGAKFLYFSGADFDSCRMVPATPSAESAVRTAAPAPKRKRDEVSIGGRQ